MAGKKKNGADPGPGHNSNALTDDEKRALTLHHKRAYEAADSLVSWHPTCLPSCRPHRGRLAWPRTTAAACRSCEAPKNLAQDAAQKWIMGWHEGQTILMAAFKKKRDPGNIARDPTQIDLSERNDISPPAVQ